MKLRGFFFILIFTLSFFPKLNAEIYGNITNRDGRLLRVNKGIYSGIRLSMNSYVLSRTEYKGHHFEFISAKCLIQEIYDKHTIVMIEKTYKGFNVNEISRVVFNLKDFNSIIIDKSKVIKTLDKMDNISKAVKNLINDYGKSPHVEGNIDSLENFKININNNEIDIKFIPVYIKNLPLKDEWGNSFEYKYDKIIKTGFTITSKGKDGKSGTEDDIILRNSVNEANILNIKTKKNRQNGYNKDKTIKHSVSDKKLKNVNNDKIVYLFGGETYVSERLLYDIGNILIKFFHPLSFHRSTIFLNDYFDNRANRHVRLRTEYRTFKGGNFLEYEIIFNKSLIPIDFNFIKDTGIVESTVILQSIKKRIIDMILSAIR